MADNLTAPLESPTTATLAADDIGGVHFPRTKLVFGADGVNEGDVSTANPLPVAGPLTDAQLRATALPVAGPLTDAQLRATALPVAGPLTDAQIRATALPVSGPLTDAQLRASAVPVAGPLTDAQLRATAVPVAVSGTVPVSAVSLPLPTGAATEVTLAALNGKAGTAIVDMPGQDTPALPVRSAPQKFTDISFSQVGSGLVAPELTLIRTGSGQTVNQSGGNLVITTGTTVNAETLIRSVDTFNGALTLKQITTLSQRIANQNFFVELADVIGDGLAYSIVNTTTVDVTLTAHGYTAQNVGQRIDLGALSSVGVPMAGVIATIPDVNTIRFTVAGWPASGSGTLSLTGWNKVELLYTGVTATVVAFNTRRRGWENVAVSPTVATTASGHMLHLNVDNGVASLGHKTLAAAQAIANVSSWESNIPQPSEDLYLQIRCRNGTTAPASTTTWTMGMSRVEDYTPAQVNITSVRQQSLAAAMPVGVVGTVPVSGTITSTVGTSITGGTISPLTVAGASAEASSAKTANGQSAAPLTNASGRNAHFTVNVSAAGGTTPSLTVRVQVQDPVSSNWVDLPSAVSAAITTTGVYLFSVSNLPRVYRLAWAITGTTPSFTFSVGILPVI